ncbi:LLM class flavin-dependent oxidoreductase [Mycolicibacterium sp. Dal123E01]|uniref:LLM class flavin-dependent oxidoreductase n=1 Tax=Mycolicibacterium sp. Dal123E01 TaxID=3457578 RepID=UPI00403E6767
MIDFGVLLLPVGGWATLFDRCERAEAMGFRSVWIDDHAVNPSTPQGNWADSFTMLAALATCTRRVLLGPLVANTILRHPVLLARQAAGIDEISDGRLQLGLGAGYAPTDHAIVGQRPWGTAERIERFGEAVKIVDALLHGDYVDFLGRYYQADHVRLRPRPVQHPRPPLCVAAHRRESLQIAARHADIWNSFGGWGLSSAELLAVTRARSNALTEYCREIGRDPAAVRRQVLAGNPAVTADPIWSSVKAFDTWVAGWQEIGIDEIILYFPPELLYEPDLVDPKVLDHLQELLSARSGGQERSDPGID